MPNPTADSKPYKIPLTVTYYDSLGRNYTRSVLVGLVVGAVPDVSIVIDESTLLQEKKTGEVSIRFVNKGVTDVKFLTATLLPSDAYTIISSPEIYVGNIDSDDYQTAAFKLYLSREQEKMISSKQPSIPLPLLVTYVDANNNPYEKRITLPLMLYSEEQLGVEKNETGTTLLVVIVLLVLLYVFYRRWEKKKQV